MGLPTESMPFSGSISEVLYYSYFLHSVGQQILTGALLLQRGVLLGNLIFQLAHCYLQRNQGTLVSKKRRINSWVAKSHVCHNPQLSFGPIANDWLFEES